jgi:hypothetical protein
MYGPLPPPNFGNKGTHPVLGYQHPRPATGYYTQPGPGYSQPIHGHPLPTVGNQQQTTRGHQQQLIPGNQHQLTQRNEQQYTPGVQQQQIPGNQQQQSTPGIQQQLALQNQQQSSQVYHQQFGQVYHQQFGQVYHQQNNPYTQPQPYAYGFEVPGQFVGGSAIKPRSQQAFINVTISTPLQVAGGNAIGGDTTAAAAATDAEQTTGPGAEAGENDGEEQAKDDEQEDMGEGNVMAWGSNGPQHH